MCLMLMLQQYRTSTLSSRRPPAAARLSPPLLFLHIHYSGSFRAASAALFFLNLLFALISSASSTSSAAAHAMAAPLRLDAADSTMMDPKELPTSQRLISPKSAVQSQYSSSTMHVESAPPHEVLNRRSSGALRLHRRLGFNMEKAYELLKQRRRSRRPAFHMMHEVPSGPNPISNYLPSSFYDRFNSWAPISPPPF